MLHSTCGRYHKLADAPVGCAQHIDYGSCGNACCILSITSKQSPSTTYKRLKSWLYAGGADRSYRCASNFTDGAGHRPSDELNLRVADKEHGGTRALADQFMLQGRHVTQAGYVDTLNFHIHPGVSGGATIRASSISGIHGSYSDYGQNYKTLAYLFAFLHPGAVQRVIFGCGHTQSQSIGHHAPASIDPITSTIPLSAPEVQYVSPIACAPNTTLSAMCALSWHHAISAMADTCLHGRTWQEMDRRKQQEAEGGSVGSQTEAALPSRGSYNFALKGAVHLSNVSWAECPASMPLQ